MRVALVNPPFANFTRPSIALTQLRSAVRAAVPDITVDIHNINLDCVPAVGTAWYTEISDGFQSWTGLGDWMFRGLAFPDAPDNADEFLEWLARYGGWFGRASVPADLRRLVLETRRDVTNALVESVRARDLSSYDVVGVTSMFSQNLAAVAIARQIKEQRAEVVTIVGGANVESPMGEALLEMAPAVDVAFSGRALVSFCEFLAHLRRAGSLSRVPAIPGVVRRSPLTVPRAQPIGLHVPPLPDLDYDDFIRELAAAPFEAELVLCFETSTGCWWGERSHCTFCGLNSTSMAYRALAPDDAVEMINSLVSRYAQHCAVFEACDNILSHDYLKTVLPRLKVPPHVSLFFEVKANLTEEHVATLARARIVRTQPGIEALSSEALRLLRKGTSALRNVALLRHCRKHGVWPDWNLLLAIPGESVAIYDQYLRELPKLVHLEPPAGAFDIRFDRFSPYFDHPEEFGLTVEPFPFYAFVYPFDESLLNRIAYCFTDGERDRTRPAVLIDRANAVRDLLATWRARWSAGPPPVLELREGDSVLDTRGEHARTRTLTTRELQLLGIFNRGRRVRNAAAEMRALGCTDAEFERALQVLRTERWLFEEDDRAVSIVVDHRRISAVLSIEERRQPAQCVL